MADTKARGIDPPIPPAPWKRWEPPALLSITIREDEERHEIAVLAWAVSDAGLCYISPDKPGVPQGIPERRILGWAAEPLPVIGGPKEEEIDAGVAAFYRSQSRRARAVTAEPEQVTDGQDGGRDRGGSSREDEE